MYITLPRLGERGVSSRPEKDTTAEFTCARARACYES